MAGPIAGLLLLAAGQAGAKPVRNAAAAPVAFSRTVTSAAEPWRIPASHPLRKQDTGDKMAYEVIKDDAGRPVLQARAFLLVDVVFSLTDARDSWPPLCEEYWSWNPPAGRFEQTVVAPWSGTGSPPCVLRGRVYFRGILTPRADFRPSVSVYVEGEQGEVPVPVRVVFEDRWSTDWTGVSVILGEIDTTSLADGPQRLRVAGGFGGIGIDGNPGTPEFDPGGDATTTFLSQNAPPRLVELTVSAGSVVAYEGIWMRETSPKDGRKRLVLRRSGGQVGRKTRGLVTLRFSVPVGEIQAGLRRADGVRIPLAAENADNTGDTGSVWQAGLDPGQLGPGKWTFEVSAHDPDGRGLERLLGGEVPVAGLGILQPDSGECDAGGNPCDLGTDTVHSITIQNR